MKMRLVLLLMSIFLLFTSNSYAQLKASFEFVYSSEARCPPYQATIKNTTTETGNVTYTWDFGNNDLSHSSGDEVYTFYDNPGTFTVTLTVDNGTETDISTQNITIFKGPEGNFTIPEGYCVGSAVPFTATVTNGDAPIKSYSWDFLGGNILEGKDVSKSYELSGNHEVVLVVKDNNNCTSIRSQLVKIDDNPQIDFSVSDNFSCAPPLSFTITNNSPANSLVTDVWTLPDGSATSTQPVQYTIQDKGNYQISLTRSNDKGCYNKVSKPVRVFDVEAAFSMYHTSVEESNLIEMSSPVGYIVFKNETIGVQNNKWIINNETYVSDPDILFCEPGIYDITLIAGTELPCADTVTKTLVITDEIPWKIVASYKGDTLNDGETICSDAISVVNPVPRTFSKWEFAGKEFTSYNPTLSTCKEGIDTIFLTSTFATGCEVKLQKPLNIERCKFINFSIKNNDTAQFTLYNNDTVYSCTGKHVFAPAFGLINSAFIIDTVGGYVDNNTDTIKSVPFEQQYCNTNMYKVSVSGAYSDGCPQKMTAYFKPDKCEIPDYAAFNISRNKYMVNGDYKCPHDSVLLVPTQPDYYVRWDGDMDSSYVDGHWAYNSKYLLGPVSMIADMPNGCRDTAMKYFFHDTMTVGLEVVDTNWSCDLQMQYKANNISSDIENVTWRWKTHLDHFDSTTIGTTALLSEPYSFSFTETYVEAYDDFTHDPFQTSAGVTLIATTKTGCMKTDYEELPKTKPQAWFYPSTTEGCAPLSVGFDGYTNEGYVKVEEVSLVESLEALLSQSLGIEDKIVISALIGLIETFQNSESSEAMDSIYTLLQIDSVYSNLNYYVEQQQTLEGIGEEEFARRMNEEVMGSLEDFALEKKHYNRIVEAWWDYGDGTIEFITPEEGLQYEIDEFMQCMAAGRINGIEEYELIARNADTKLDYYQSYRMLILGKNPRSSEVLNNKIDNCINSFRAKFHRTHVYANPGTYYPKYFVKDMYGCVDSSYSIEIEVGDKLAPDFTFTPASVCYGDTITFTDNTPNPELIDSWHYYSGEAQINSQCSSDPNPSFQVMPLSTDSADIRFTVEYNGCFSTVTKEKALEIKGPIGNFTFEPMCELDTRMFQLEASVSGADSLVWNIEGKDTLANQEKPVYTFASDGEYTVFLTSINKTSGCANYVDSLKISAKELIPRLVSDSVFCYDSTKLVTLDSSLNANKSRLGMYPYLLYVNDKPMYRTKSGNYYVDANANTNLEFHYIAYDENECKREDTIQYRVHRPKATFVANTDYLCAPEDSIVFTYTSLDSTIVYWNWNYGDGASRTFKVADSTTDTIAHTHVYSFPDTIKPFLYNFTMSQKDIWGCIDTAKGSIATHIPIANATIVDETLCLGDPLNSNHTYSKADSSEWIVYRLDKTKDSIFSHTNNKTLAESILMNERGQFKLIQVAHELRCVDTLQLGTIIDVEQLDPYFTITDSLICEGDSISFVHKTKLDENNGTWKFSQDPSASMAYVDSARLPFTHYGTNTITLTLNSPNGCTDSHSESFDVNTARYTVSDPDICKGDRIKFSILYTKLDSAYINYGDGNEETIYSSEVFHKYNQRGDFTINVISYTPGCSISFTEPDAINVEQVSAYVKLNKQSFCKVVDSLLMIHPIDSIMDATSGIWYLDYDNNNREVYSFDTNAISRKLFTNEIIKVGLSVESDNGCTDDTLYTVSVNGPDVNFTASKDPVCINEEVTFNMIDTNNVSRFDWIVRGEKDTTNSTLHYTFRNDVGKAPITLTVYDDFNCTNYVRKEIFIREVIADFTFNDTDSAICIGSAVDIIDNSQNNDIAHWEYGDGYESNDLEPEDHIYEEPGDYNIRLHIENSQYGCIDDTVVPLRVQKIPEILVNTIDSICDYDTLHIKAKYESHLTSTWQKENTTIAENVMSYIDTELDNDVILYTVTVQDTVGCTATDSVNVAVLFEPRHFVVPADTGIYIGEKFTPVVITRYPSTFTWGGDYQISCLECPNPEVRPLEDYTYTVHVEDMCYEKDYEIPVKVYPEAKLKLPSAFTPNGDGENDVLYIRGWGIKDVYEFKVFNRWGQEVFSTEDLETGWDGTFNGEPQPADTYVYKVRIYSFLDDERYVQGYVDLLR